MKNMKHLIAGFVIGVVMAVAPSCGTTKACSSTTCSTGCCDAKGECQSGTSNGACGQLGGTCQICQIAQACSLGTCAQTNGNGGGTNNGGGTGGSGGGAVTGGGTGGGGGGTTTGGGGGTCDGCIFQGGCINRANSNNNTLCGQGGVACATCSGTQSCQNFVCAAGTTGGGGGTATGGGGGTACDGCRLPSGSCSPAQLSANSTTNCGLGGVACVACGSGQLCSNGVCGNTAPTGTIGAACNTNADCSGVALTTKDTQIGVAVFCKKTATNVTAAGSLGVAYTNGYCTKRCGFEETPAPGSCGSVATCTYLLGDIGEADNVCFKNCVADADCGRTDYFCLGYSQTTGICLPRTLLRNLPDGGQTIDNLDAGAGFFGAAGGACTLDTQCQPPTGGACLKESLDAGYVGGACTAECTATWTNNRWCGTNGLCSPAYAGRDSQSAPVIRWFCERGCGAPADGGVAGTCRTGYACEGTGQFATCTPKCTNSGVVCGTGTSCNTFTGLCQ